MIGFVVFNSFWQELNIPTYTQYLGDNPYVISPAYAGIGDNIKIRINGKTNKICLISSYIATLNKISKNESIARIETVEPNPSRCR